MTRWLNDPITPSPDRQIRTELSMPISANIPHCQYIRTDGRRCGSPALKTKRWCYFHYEVNRKTVTLDVPPLEDGNAVQLALTDLARAVADDRIPLKNAALLAYVLQTASANLKRVQLGVFTDSMVRDLPDLDPYSRGPAHESSVIPSAPSAETASAPSAETASAPSAVKGSDPRHSVSSAAKSSAPSAVKGSYSLPRKIEAAKAGSLNDAKELLDLLDAVS
jgi:hypothetical protein